MTHSRYIQAAIKYIEMNLNDNLSIDKIAQEIGFSKFYFHRLFQNEIGISVYDYIRKRRLANAAALLLYSDLPILDIALNSDFESQEAFSRAFKSVYQLPPGKYRVTIRNTIMGGLYMENGSATIKNWIVTGTAPEKYRADIDHKIYHTGTKSATIQSVAEAFEVGEFATIMQQFSAKNFVDKRVCFSGFVRTENVEDWCGLWMRFDNGLGVVLRLDNMQNRPITGTTEWNHYSCVLDVPPDSAIINIGILLSGKGQAWLDNAAFGQVDCSVPTTDFAADDVFPDYPENLLFED